MPDSDHRHFLELFLRHQAGLYAFVVAGGVPPTDADDVLQNVAALLWERFDEYRPGSNFRAWAFAVTRLEVLKAADRWKRDTRVIRLGDDALDKLVAAADEADDQETDPGLARHLRGCLDGLGDHARQMIAWYYGEGRSYEDIAAELGISQGALRTRLCRIRKGLQSCLERKERPA